jgi:starch phosphorylase
LDTNLDCNRPIDRDLTDQLYGGDRDTRIRQEILLGIGGYRMLKMLDIRPTVLHMNEGHSAFLALEHTRNLMQCDKLSFAEAREVAGASLVFTTHTPVIAGHDYFDPILMERYFADYARSLGLGWNEFLALGRRNPSDRNEPFCMTVLAMRMAAFRNGVSKLHGSVSRHMWNMLWPGVPEDELPITHITNGVHFRSWISYEMNQLYDRYLGPSWREEPADCRLWRRVEAIPAEELWRTHERRRERTVAFTRRRLRAQLERRGVAPSEIEDAGEVLDPEILTIGFARRFATYKRASLIFRDPQRLSKLINDPQRPIQIIFAGKAHPQDGPGKEIIQQIVSLARRDEFRHRIVFLEDYDLAVARYLVQGVDVWLNTPLRPQEASGTSGMKASANGAMNVSTLDGWWDEAWTDARKNAQPIGWTIGNGELYADRNLQDQVESEALYDLLERDIVPAFYDRNSARLPMQWIRHMKVSLASLCCRFNSHRMVKEYTERFYLIAHTAFTHMNADSGAAARALAIWLERIRQTWHSVSISIDTAPTAKVSIGEPITIRARVMLGSLTPQDVIVEAYLGRIDARGELVENSQHRMEPVKVAENGAYIYETRSVKCSRSGSHGYSVRVMPDHPDLSTPFWLGLVTWAETEKGSAAAPGM